jgi:hypothetical protein
MLDVWLACVKRVLVHVLEAFSCRPLHLAVARLGDGDCAHGLMLNSGINLEQSFLNQPQPAIHSSFHRSYEWRGWVALIMVGFIMLFRSFSYIGLAFMNFQVR